MAMRNITADASRWCLGAEDVVHRSCGNYVDELMQYEVPSLK